MVVRLDDRTRSSAPAPAPRASSHTAPARVLTKPQVQVRCSRRTCNYTRPHRCGKFDPREPHRGISRAGRCACHVGQQQPVHGRQAAVPQSARRGKMDVRSLRRGSRLSVSHQGERDTPAGHGVRRRTRTAVRRPNAEVYSNQTVHPGRRSTREFGGSRGADRWRSRVLGLRPWGGWTYRIALPRVCGRLVSRSTKVAVALSAPGRARCRCPCGEPDAANLEVRSVRVRRGPRSRPRETFGSVNPGPTPERESVDGRRIAQRRGLGFPRQRRGNWGCRMSQPLVSANPHACDAAFVMVAPGGGVGSPAQGTRRR